MSETATAKSGQKFECPVCKEHSVSSVLSVTTDATYSILVCGKCRLAFAAPRPTAEELNRFYSSTYFTRNRDTNLGYADYRNLAELNARNMWKEFKDFASLSSLLPKRILDVGCATGGFLSEAQADGWQCIGVELSQDAVIVAREEFRLNVFNGDIFHPELSPNSFDVITMWHVVEHMIDPGAALSHALTLLTPGGLLFVELPNWNSVGRLVKKERWSQLKPPEHINFFTPDSLRYAVEQAGFDVITSISHYECSRTRMAIHAPISSTKALAKIAAAKAGHGGYVRLLARKK